MKKLIVIRGPLGVGKSTISKILAQQLQASYLSLDQILKENDLEGVDGIPLANFLKANEIIADLVRNSDCICIVDGCFYYQEQLDDLQKRFKQNIVIFTLLSNVEKCIERDSKREKVYGEEAARFVHSITSKIHAGFEIDNSALTIPETVTKIMGKICPTCR